MAARQPRKVTTSVKKLDLPYGSPLLPESLHTIKLKKDEVLVWTLDYEQYKDIDTESMNALVDTIRAGLKRTFPKNTVIVTIGKTDIRTYDDN